MDVNPPATTGDGLYRVAGGAVKSLLRKCGFFATYFHYWRINSPLRYPQKKTGVGRVRGKSTLITLDAMHICAYNYGMEIEFDLNKAALNLQKHGVELNEGVGALLDSCALTRHDPDSRNEVRWLTLGMSRTGSMLVVVWTERGDAVRLISARKATKQEERIYAQRI